jgi:hypothetical protein
MPACTPAAPAAAGVLAWPGAVACALAAPGVNAVPTTNRLANPDPSHRDLILLHNLFSSMLTPELINSASPVSLCLAIFKTKILPA